MSCCAWFRLSVVYIMERWKTLDRSGIRAYLQTHMRGQSSLGSIHRGVSGLLGDRLGVRPIDKKPSQSPWLRQRKPACHAAGALHDTPGGLLPFQKVAVRGCESMVINPPLETRCVGETVLHTFRPGVARSAIPHFQGSNGPFAVGATAYHNDIAMACTVATARSSHQRQDPVRPVHTIDETDEKQPTSSRKQPPIQDPSRGLSKLHVLKSYAAAILLYSTPS